MASIEGTLMNLITEVMEKLPARKIFAIMASIAAWCLWVGIFTKQSAAQTFGQAWQYLNFPFYLEIRDWVTSHPPVFTILFLMLLVILILGSFQTSNVYSSNLSTILYLCAFVSSMQGIVRWPLIEIFIFLFIFCWFVVVVKIIYSHKEESIIGIKEWLKSENGVFDIFWPLISVFLVLVYPLLLLNEILNVK